MKFVLFFVSLATFVVYSQAVAYGVTCSGDGDCTATYPNAACVGTTTKTCGCASDAFSETVGSTTSCYKNVGAISCDNTNVCHTSGKCSSAGACICPNPKTPDTNLQKCVSAGAAGIAASILSVAVVVVTSRFL